MKRLFKLVAMLLLVASPFFVSKAVLAQTSEEQVVPIMEEVKEIYESNPVLDTVKDYNLDDWNFADETTDNTLTDEEAAAVAIFTTLFGGAFLIFAIIFSLLMYVYSAITMQKVADKLGYKDSWYAWIPILNSILFFRMGDQNPWLLLLVLIPVVGTLILSVISIIPMMRICEKMGYDKLFGLLTLVPLAGLILWGVLAWGKSPSAQAKSNTK